MPGGGSRVGGDREGCVLDGGMARRSPGLLAGRRVLPPDGAVFRTRAICSRNLSTRPCGEWSRRSSLSGEAAPFLVPLRPSCTCCGVAEQSPHEANCAAAPSPPHPRFPGESHSRIAVGYRILYLHRGIKEAAHVEHRTTGRAYPGRRGSICPHLFPLCYPALAVRRRNNLAGILRRGEGLPCLESAASFGGRQRHVLPKHYETR